MQYRARIYGIVLIKIYSLLYLFGNRHCPDCFSSNATQRWKTIELSSEHWINNIIKQLWQTIPCISMYINETKLRRIAVDRYSGKKYFYLNNVHIIHTIIIFLPLLLHAIRYNLNSYKPWHEVKIFFQITYVKYWHGKCH